MDPASRRLRSQRGGASALLMVLIVVLALLAAGIITVGRLASVRQDLQNAADAVALQGAYRLERYGMAANGIDDVLPAAALALANAEPAMSVRWTGWGDEGGRGDGHAFAEVRVRMQSAFEPTSGFFAFLRRPVEVVSRARVDQDILDGRDLQCVFSTSRFYRVPLGCRAQLSRAVRDQFQLTPHAFRRAPSGREQRLPLRDFVAGAVLLDVAECAHFVDIRGPRCAAMGSQKLVIRYNRPELTR